MKVPYHRIGGVVGDDPLVINGICTTPRGVGIGNGRYVRRDLLLAFGGDTRLLLLTGNNEDWLGCLDRNRVFVLGLVSNVHREGNYRADLQA